MTEPTLSFQGENSDEDIQFVLRRHPWSLIRPGLMIVGLLLVVTAVFWLFQGSWVTSWAIFLLIPIALYLGARAWFVWANSLFVLTNERVIITDQTGWFSRTVKEVMLVDIISISHEVNGALATMLNFGDIIIQAAGATEKDLVMKAIYDPYEVQQRIIRAKRGDRQKS